MKRFHLISSVAACVCLGLGAPAVSAQTAATPAAKTPPPTVQTADVSKPAEACLKTCARSKRRCRRGYWLGGSGNAYGYPMGGYGYGYTRPMAGSPADRPAGYQNARPGYEIHILMASANILAQNGQQQPCEDVLATTRTIYTTYAANLHGSGMMARTARAGSSSRSSRPPGYRPECRLPIRPTHRYGRGQREKRKPWQRS